MIRKEVHFDNWFSSLLLIKVLHENDICATGVVRVDHLGEHTKINKKDIKKQKRNNSNPL